MRSVDIDTREDGIGNLYATQPGTGAGHLLLVAHLDKELCANRFENAGSGTFDPDDTDDAMAVHPGDVHMFEYLEGDFVRLKTELPANPLQLRRLYGVLTWPGDGIYVLPKLRTENGFITGKLDDAVGLALILDLLMAAEGRPSMTVSALFTVGEENGFVGATYASREGLIDELNPDAILVLDVTRDGHVGEGPGLYLNQGRGDSQMQGDEQLAASIIGAARNVGWNLNASWRPNELAREDTRAIGRHTKYPVAALKVPVKNLHGFSESATWRDIELEQSILRARVGGAKGLQPDSSSGG